jgi:hypothetical protein
MIMDITTKTKQMTMTTHFGVSSKDLPPLPLAMILNSPRQLMDRLSVEFFE